MTYQCRINEELQNARAQIHNIIVKDSIGNPGFEFLSGLVDFVDIFRMTLG